MEKKKKQFKPFYTLDNGLEQFTCRVFFSVSCFLSVSCNEVRTSPHTHKKLRPMKHIKRFFLNCNRNYWSSKHSTKQICCNCSLHDDTASHSKTYEVITFLVCIHFRLRTTIFCFVFQFQIKMIMLKLYVNSKWVRNFELESELMT